MLYILYLAPLIFLSPLAALILLSVIGLTNYRSNEMLIKRVVMVSQIISLIVSAAVFITLLLPHAPEIVPIRIVEWKLFSFGEHSLDFRLSVDRLSACFVLLSVILTNIVGVFSQNYLHRDASFYRFFFLNTLFLNGIIILFTGASFQVLFVGWEVVGITSALLISFFNIRREAVDNALHAFWAYRVSDIGLLSASAILGSHFSVHVFNSDNQPTTLHGFLEYLIPLALLLSAMGKSAQYPFSSWLPKAMEGPTSSSAIFYGGLSIHAGVYLLLRMSSEFTIPSAVSYLIIVVGLISAIYGVMISQVQSDVKSALAYASLSQVGIMFVEIGLGFYKIVILHAIGHAFLRTYQILKSASIIHEFLDFEDAHQYDKQRKMGSVLGLFISEKTLQKIFSYSFDMALKDTSSPSRVILALEGLARIFNRIEDGWIDYISGIKTQDTGK